LLREENSTPYPVIVMGFKFSMISSLPEKRILFERRCYLLQLRLNLTNILPAFFPLQPFQSELYRMSFDQRVFCPSVPTFFVGALPLLLKLYLQPLEWIRKKKTFWSIWHLWAENVGWHLPHSRPGDMILKVKYVLLILVYYCSFEIFCKNLPKTMKLLPGSVCSVATESSVC